ncbi:MAG: GntP family gluconate:H+ symporter [Pirellulaceae bacterium]|jgi:GntP family gluconate:H+ symporter
MHPAFILLIGVVIVIGGILVFRMHAFLALALGALAVAALTPQQNIERYWLEKNSIEVVARPAQDTFHLAANTVGIRPGAVYYVELDNVRENSTSNVGEWTEIVVSSIKKDEATETSYAIAKLVDPSIAERATDLVSDTKSIGFASKESKKTIGERVALAFGTTCGKIGILIALAAIIGKCLLDSGAADRIVRAALSVTGESGAPFAFMGSGFLLGVPVFFDTVFYLMVPLGKSLRMRTGRNYLLYILTIVCGASMAHSLVPPTPGPLLVADALGVDIGMMILFGSFVGLFSSAAGYFYAVYRNRHNELPLRESADLSLEDLEALSKRDISELPPLFLSLVPILLPVLFIAGHTICVQLHEIDLITYAGTVKEMGATFGNKNIALMIAAIVSLWLLYRQKRTDLKELSAAAQSALSSGGVIILITAAGGAFGAMLQQTGVAGLIKQLPSGSPQLLIVLAFFITTAIRTAQGSATVAMITAVGVLAAFSDPQQLGCHPIYLALAIGCGSKPVAWMNDSGFWVICKMSGMTEQEGLRFVTPMSILMGVTGLVVTLILSTVLPMV